jgi:hypothetical protein
MAKAAILGNGGIEYAVSADQAKRLQGVVLQGMTSHFFRDVIPMGMYKT